MKTESQSISDVLTKNNTSFYIPPFQRAYAWGKPEIDRYFQDIVRIVESEIDEQQRDKLEHFFGTLVIKTEQENFATRSIIVDGQQRLTTTLIFVVALRDTISSDEQILLINKNFLKNDSSTYEDKIKLKQVTKDWESYRALVNGTEIPHGPIRAAYELFCKKIALESYDLDNYLVALRRVNTALIFLDERPYKGEDPQIIFETLNSLGKPLTLADLVRNYILLQMDSYDQTEIFEGKWHPRIEEVFGDLTSHFFRDYLQYKLSTSLKVVSDNNTKELYRIFKDYVDSNFNSKKDFVDDIIKFAPWYKIIITKENYVRLSEDVKANRMIIELLRNIFFDIGTDPFKPFVLGLIEYHQDKKSIDDKQLIETLTIIKIYLIRRRTLKLTQAENKNFPTFSRRISEIAQGTISMIDILANQQYALRLPNDIEITDRLKDVNFYEDLKGYSHFILGKIEENNTKVSVDFRDDNVTIEHIMPQTLTNQWMEHLGPDYEEVHNSYLHNIGNLILTEFNSEVGNKEFDLKKKKYDTSSLYYRLDILQNDKWTEAEILEHQERMIKWYLATFPIPEELTKTRNWNEEKIDRTAYSPMDDGVDHLLKGTKPNKLIFDKIEYEVKTWQEVYLKFLEYFSQLDPNHLDYIMLHQERVLGGKNAMKYVTPLKDDINELSSSAYYYKTVDGIGADELPNNYEGYVYYVRSSVETIIGRVVGIMKEFNIEPSRVSIEIK